MKHDSLLARAPLLSGLSHPDIEQKLCRVDLLSIRVIWSVAWQIFQLPWALEFQPRTVGLLRIKQTFVL
jgi:hypothetical protein